MAGCARPTQQWHRCRWRRPVAACLITALGYVHALGQEDTVRVFDKLDNIAEKHRAFRWLYDAVFVRYSDPVTAPAPAPTAKRVDPNARFRGRWIRHVDVQVLDPFGSNLHDTTATYETNGLERWGNRWHVRTRSFVIRRLLLLGEGDRLDPLHVSESERVLRNSPVVNDARVLVVPVKNARDSVDILVLVQDRWTLNADLNVDATSVSAGVNETNVLGFGQELNQRFDYSLQTPQPSWSGFHRIHNIDQSFIRSTIAYALEPEQDRVSVSLDRPFYSPLALWAGNISAGHAWLHPAPDTTDGADLVTVTANRYDLDAWAGWSIGTGKGVPAERATSLVLAGRFATSWYNAIAPRSALDSLYNENRLALVSASLSKRQYAKDQYIYRFGLIEDVAEGTLLTATGGGRWGPDRTFEPYVGVAASRAFYFDKSGYVNLSAGFGSYLPKGEMRDGIVQVQARYFTPLHTVGRWRLRYFARLVFAKVLSPETAGSVNINGQQLLGFEPTDFTGDWKGIVKVETVVYLPYQFIGFRFAPVLTIAAGTLGAEHEPIFRRPVQPAFGLGLLIRNERLIVRTFQLSFAYYPQQVHDGPDPFRWDALEGFQLRNPDLASSRPDVIGVP